MNRAMETLSERFKPENWSTLACPKCGANESVHVSSVSTFTACDRCWAIEVEQRRDEERERFAAAERKSRRERWGATLAKAATPVRYQKAPDSRDGSVIPALPDRLLSWRGDPWCLVFTGEVGCGKSTAATRLLGELACETDLSCLWSDASETIEKLFLDFRGERSAAGYLESLVAAEVLLIDDLGAVRNDTSREADFVRSKLGYILRQRYNWERLTIITTDLGMAGLEARIASRVFNGGEEIAVPGRDRRLA